MTKLTKYEKETILLTNEGDDTYDIYTFNPSLQRKLAKYSASFPKHCRLKSSTPEGSRTYVIDKDRMSIRLLPPPSEERRKAAAEKARLINQRKALQN